MASLKKNILSLFLVQIFHYIIPLLQLPYLSRVLGIELFGVMAFMLALIQFINVLTDYGFNLYIPQIVAGGRNSHQQVSILSSNIFTLKLGFSLVGYILFWAIILFNSSYAAYYDYALIVSLSIIGNALFPICIYQGLEKLTTISKMIISCKFLALLLVLILVKSPADFISIAIINTSQIILLTLIAFIGLYKQKIILKMSFIHKIELIQLLINAFPFFISRLSVSLYTVGAGVFLGMFSTPIQVAYYNVAEQLYKASQQVFTPLYQALYPYMIRTKDYQVFFKVLFVAIVIAIIGAMMGFVWGKPILVFIFGENFAQAKSILDVFMATIVFNTLAVMMGYTALSPLGLAKYANRSVILSGMVQLCLLVFILCFIHNITGVIVASSILICELFTCLYRGRKFVNYFKAHNETAKT
ncbi:oligosaccharide flippase family protein [Candidatus Schmidhempelia bombi]|uniref:Flippase n=1 Tax=Candidatus Schmidhempelia bombi str. Bimp TaxID=1387197 RepID=A0AB94IAV1_9GAMM|nr:oligosaccharide flippase family protein [Candidatus Schmidhempelia bombi]TEA26532.1 hypothetical protein O970_08395 [Candidatus Schmidhempelia bombi str. Bimp]